MILESFASHFGRMNVAAAECGPIWFASPIRQATIWADTGRHDVGGEGAGDGRARTYAAQFGRCDQVIAGTGAAATIGGRLLADIRLLVPNSGL